MLRIQKIIISATLFTLTTAVSASEVDNSVNKLINSIDPDINMGIMVVDLNTGQTLYKRNAQKSFIPASNMKLFSDAAALMVLGPDYRFHTQLSTDAHSLDKGTLKGSLFVHMHGDPSFSQEQLAALVSKLKSWDIQRIEGNVILVSDNQTISPYPEGWSQKDLTSSYGAPIAPLILDENRLSVTINPSHKVGAPAIIEFDRAYHGLNISNNIKTTRQKRGCGISFKMDHENNVTLSGCINVTQPAVQHGIAIRNPLLYAKSILRHTLEEQHVTLDGDITLGTAPKNTLLLATQASSTMRTLMPNTLKSSDNLYADSLYLHASSKLAGKPVNWTEAQNTIKQFLEQKAHLNMNGAVLADGSGLSRHDQLTPEQTIQLLSFLHNHFPLAYEYIGSLPIGGIDGTLKRRFKKPAQQGLIRAKTGTMSGIISLSGYLYSANGHTLAFAIYVNKAPGTDPKVSGRYRYLVDKLCSFFISQAPDNKQVATKRSYQRTAFQGHRQETKKIISTYSSWRKLEHALRQSMRHQAVDIVFRDNKMLLIDHNHDVDKVWVALQSVRKTHDFAIALEGFKLPHGQNTDKQLLWVKRPIENPKMTHRTWTIYAATH